MKLWKILLPVTLCLVLALLFLPTTANAASSGTCGDNLTWTLDDAGTLTISGTGPMEDNSEGGYHDLPVKKAVIEEGVTTIGAMAFYSCHDLTSVTIPDSVTAIGNGAFFELENLTTVTMGSGVKTIGIAAFEYCSKLTSITIPDGVTSIGRFAFCGTGLTSVAIAEGVTAVDMGVFGSCKDLVSVTIPKSVTAIGEQAFFECVKLKDVHYGGTQAQWDAISIGSYNAELRNATIHFVIQGIPGDLNGNEQLTTDDAVYLLLHVMFGAEDYPVPDGMLLDFNGDSKLDTNDAVYLLLHVMFGAEDYPLAA